MRQSFFTFTIITFIKMMTIMMIMMMMMVIIMMPIIILIIVGIAVSITTIVNIITFICILLIPYLICMCFLILIFTCCFIALLFFNWVRASLVWSCTFIIPWQCFQFFYILQCVWSSKSFCRKKIKTWKVFLFYSPFCKSTLNLKCLVSLPTFFTILRESA